MYQTDRRIVRVISRQVTQIPCNGINQCSVEIAATRMYHHSRWFVDDHQLVILVDYLQRDILRLYRRIIMGTVEHQGDNITRTDLIITLDGLTIDLNKTCIRRLLDAVA